MKFERAVCITAVALFTLLAIPVRLVAQEHKVKHHKYRLVDLGTFGGPTSSTDAGSAISGNGAVVASADTTVSSPPNSDPVFCGGPFVRHALRWRHGKSTDLGALSPSGNNCSIGDAINDGGDVAGISENGVIDPILGVIEIRAVRWKHGKIIDLGTFGGNQSASFSVNSKREIVGIALNGTPDPFSFYDFQFFGSSNGTQTRAFVLKDGKMNDLGTLGGPDAWAGNVNEHGQIAGFSYTSFTPNQTTGVPTQDPFLWDDQGMIDLGSLGGTFAFTTGLNNRGQVIGVSNLAADQTSHPFFWDKKTGLTDIGTFGGDNGEAASLNDAGEVVGSADFPGNQVHDGFLWKRGKKLIDLGKLGLTSRAFSINSKSQVVGNSLLSDGTTIHPFLWERGKIVDLNDLISPKSDVVLQGPLTGTIADSGEILVNGLPLGCSDQGTCGHAYVMIPDGDCDSDCEGRIAARQNSAAQYPATMKHSSEPPAHRVDQLRGRLGRRYHIPGRQAGPSD